LVNVIHKTEATSRVADRRELKIEQILDRAMAILEADGLDALTLQRVAQTLGLVTTAMYRYFPSKDALMAALQRRSIRVISAHFERELSSFGEGLSDVAAATGCLARLLTVAELYLALPETHPQEWRFVATLLGDPRELVSDGEVAITAPLLAGFLSEMEKLFVWAERVEALSHGHARERVFAFWAALHGAHCMEKARRVSPSAPSVGEIGRFTSRALLSSWGATPARLAAAQRHLAGGARAVGGSAMPKGSV
jgi:AcrR family transcriptional regulator